MLRLLAFSFALFGLQSFAASMHFPLLTGRVVDEAQLLSPEIKSQLESKLAAFEKETSVQLVVLSLHSLRGQEIEEYGTALGRHWGIGQKGKNNGLILIVVPDEKKVRIEVGYGLEEKVTDALSSSIIQTVMIPHFKQNDYAQGIAAGVDALLQVLHGEYRVAQNDEQKEKYSILIWFFIIMIFAIGFFGRRRRFFGGGGWGGGSGGSGGGFSGGGGSFGGGGSSGRW